MHFNYLQYLLMRQCNKLKLSQVGSYTKYLVFSTISCYSEIRRVRPCCLKIPQNACNYVESTSTSMSTERCVWLGIIPILAQGELPGDFPQSNSGSKCSSQKNKHFILNDCFCSWTLFCFYVVLFFSGPSTWKKLSDHLSSLKLDKLT